VTRGPERATMRSLCSRDRALVELGAGGGSFMFKQLQSSRRQLSPSLRHLKSSPLGEMARAHSAPGARWAGLALPLPFAAYK